MSARVSRKPEPDLPGLFDDVDLVQGEPSQTKDSMPREPLTGANDDDARPTKLDAEELALRGTPQPVKRLSPRAIILLTAVALGALAAVIIASLRPPKLKDVAVSSENYDVALKPKPDALEDLPKTYADWLAQIRAGKRPQLPMGDTAAVPQLGPPLPGDIGHAYALKSGLGEQGQEAGAGYANATATSTAAQHQAEQLRLVEQARGSGLFFSNAAAIKTGTGAATEATDKDAMDLIAKLSGTGTGAGPAPTVATENNTPPNESRNAAIPVDGRSTALGQKQADSETLNPHALTPLVSPYTILAGTVIPAALIGELNSDLPGMVQAHVSENVYDSVSGQWLLIPQGAKLIGRYDARVIYGQERALLVWTRLILPDGGSMVLDNMAAVDAKGSAGLAGEVNVHSGRLIKGVILSSLLGVGSELSLGNDRSNSLQALARAIQQSGNTAGQEIVRRALEVKPTIHVKAGSKVQVLVSQDLLLKPWGDNR